MFTSDLSDVEEEKTKTNNYTSEMKRKVNSLSNNPSERPSILTFFFTIPI